MRLGVSIPVEEGLSIGELVGLAQAAERHGYEAVVAGEVAGPDAFALLTAIAAVLLNIYFNGRRSDSDVRREAAAVAGHAEAG